MMLSPPINRGLKITHTTTAPREFMATYFWDEGYDLVGVSTWVFCINSMYTTMKVVHI